MYKQRIRILRVVWEDGREKKKLEARIFHLRDTSNIVSPKLTIKSLAYLAKVEFIIENFRHL